MLTYRELDRSEFDRIPKEATDGITLPDSNCRVVAAINDRDQIVAIWAAVAVVHLEPIWIKEEHRKSPTLIRRLWAALRNVLKTEGVQSTMTVIPNNKPATRRIAEWCGAREVDGKLFFLDVGA